MPRDSRKPVDLSSVAVIEAAALALAGQGPSLGARRSLNLGAIGLVAAAAFGLQTSDGAVCAVAVPAKHVELRISVREAKSRMAVVLSVAPGVAACRRASDHRKCPASWTGQASPDHN